MPVEYHPYWFVAALLGVGAAFALTPLLLARLWARRISLPRSGPSKEASYECGLTSAGVGPFAFKSEYYLYAILFLIFDVETVFLLPFAVSFLELPPGAVAAMAVFVLLLVEGLAWTWMKGVLTWK